MSDPDDSAGSNDPAAYNQRAWDHQVTIRNRWTVPVNSEQIARARAGEWNIVLTPCLPVPKSWLEPIAGKKILCLASGGGQQGPILSAAGGNVTVFDLSDQQLAQDRRVAEREGLSLQTVQGDMRDLATFDDQTFDLIVHPCSNTFVPDVRPVWREAFRVLKPGGAILSGFCNPLLFVFDWDKSRQGKLEVRHSIPYSDQTDLTKSELEKLESDREPLCFGHTLEDQIGGQLDAGLVMTGLYEDRWGSEDEPLDRHIASFIATRSVRPIL